MQKFGPRSRVGIFHNERTHSTPLDPKLTFWCVLYYLGTFGTIWLPYETRCKMPELVQKFVPRSRVGIFRNERTRSTPLDPKLPSSGCLTKLGAKRAELVQKFVPRSRFGIFRNERTRSPHWTLNYRFGAFCTIWVHSGPFCCLTKLGAKRAELVLSCHEVTSKLFATNAPDPPHRILN